MVFPGYKSPPSPPPSLLDLHPVEAFLALLLISAAALLRLVRPQVAADWKRQPLVRATWIQPETSTACALAAHAAAKHLDEQLRRVRGIELQASADPAVGIAPRATVVDLATWSVTELRAMAKAKGRIRVYSASARGFIPISQASKSELIAELE